MPNEIVLKSGLRLYFEDVGKGLPVICIPGWCYSTAVFERNLPALSRQYRAISFDPRSHGRSQVTADGNDYTQHGRDLQEFLEALQLTDCVLLGWSLGVYTIYSHVEQFGSNGIRAVIAVDESPKIIKQHADDWGEGLVDDVKSVVDMAGADFQEFFRGYMAEGFVNPPDDVLLDRFTQAATVVSPEVAAALLANAAQMDFCQTASELAAEVPVLNIVRRDWSSQARQWIAANQPTATTRVLGKHLMLYEFAEEFNACVQDFLAALSK